MNGKHAFGAAVLDAPARNVVLYSQGVGVFTPTHSYTAVKDEQTGVESNVLQVSGMPVFRSGQFKDSMGELSTWETLHIDQMVSSFDFLREQKVFPEVPVREGHGSFFGEPMTGLVGYHTGLRAQDAVAPDGEAYRFLLADFTLHTQKAQEAYLSGLWRNRSAEVGYYESNNGTGYYPVYQGFAFVDIPAVQFLNQFGQQKQRSFSVLLEKEIPMTLPIPAIPPATVNPDGSPAPGGAPAPAQPAAPANFGAQPAAPAQPAAQPAAPAAPFAFSCAGQQTTDHAAVQSYITKLETEAANHLAYRKDQTRAGRVAFVKGLASTNKILAAQVGADEAGQETGLVALAVSMDDAQFAAWSATYEALPVNPLFSRQPTGGAGDPAESDISEDEKNYAAAKARVQWHRDGKMAQATLENTESWKTYSRLHTALGKKGEL